MSDLPSYDWESGITKLSENITSLTTHFLKQLQRPAFPCLLQQYSVNCYPILHLTISYMWGRFGAGGGGRKDLNMEKKQ